MTGPITNPIIPATLQQPVACWTRCPHDYPARFTASVETSSALHNMYQKICNFCADRFLELRIVFRSIWTIASSTSTEMQTQIGDIENFMKTINECDTPLQREGVHRGYLYNCLRNCMKNSSLLRKANCINFALKRILKKSKK